MRDGFGDIELRFFNGRLQMRKRIYEAPWSGMTNAGMAHSYGGLREWTQWEDVPSVTEGKGDE